MTTRQLACGRSPPRELTEHNYTSTEFRSTACWISANASVLEQALPQRGNQVTLPSFSSLCRTLQQPAGTVPPESGERAVTSNIAMYYSPIAVDTYPAITIASAAQSPPMSRLSSPDFAIVTDQVMADGYGDKFSPDPRERALAANQIIFHYFGHKTWPALCQIKENRDENRPLYGSDTQVSNRGPKSTKKHSMKERSRRDDHSIMFREQNRRMPVQIMELAGYPSGSRKPPGKNHLHVAGVMMTEFDAIIQVKMEQEIFSLRALLYGSKGAGRYPNPGRCPSSNLSAEDSASICGSPRKRKRDTANSTESLRMPPPPSPSSSIRSSPGYFSPKSDTPSAPSPTW